MAKQHDDSEWVVFYLLASIVMGFLAAIATLAYQTWQFLQTGEWLALSLLSPLRLLKLSWALSPQSWFGLYKIFDAIPLSLALFLAFPVFSLLRSVLGAMFGLQRNQ